MKYKLYKKRHIYYWHVVQCNVVNLRNINIEYKMKRNV